MTTNQSRTVATDILHEHQPNDIRFDPATTGNRARSFCTCGEELPPGKTALAVHQVNELLTADLLRADLTPPLSLESLHVLEPGEVVFDVDGIAWSKAGARIVASDVAWITFDERVVPNLASSADLHAERSPLSLYREPSRGADS